MGGALRGHRWELMVNFRHMRRVRNAMALLAIMSFVSALAAAPRAEAKEFDPRVKVVLLTSAYGAVGGAVVGLATTAFGAKSRNILMGASLGLYAGIGIGLFMVFGPRPVDYYRSGPASDDYDAQSDRAAQETG